MLAPNILDSRAWGFDVGPALPRVQELVAAPGAAVDEAERDAADKHDQGPCGHDYETAGTLRQYATFVRDGVFEPFFRGADGMVAQAQRQIAAANGVPIEWHFAEEAAAEATRALFAERGIAGIHVRFTP